MLMLVGHGHTPCCRQFTSDHYREMRGWCSELTKGERDLVIKSQILAMTSTSTHTKRSTQRYLLPVDRQREYTSYFHQGLRVCLDTFLFLHGIKHGIFKALKRSCRKDGLVSRVHGNTRRTPKHALSFEEVKQVVSFVTNYAEEHAIQLPGRIPGYKRSDLQLLPCSTTRRSVWHKYCHATTSLPDIRAVSYPSFCSLWQQLLPSILPTRPMTDLCAVCHDRAILISRSSNLSEAAKSQVHNYVSTHDKRGNHTHCINFCLNYTFRLHIFKFVAYCHYCIQCV